jgi:L-amino acid N-acyltransferase YncA
MTIIRLATSADAQGILDIYAPYILNTSLTFETEVPDTDSFRDRIISYLSHWPWLVCEADGKIAGYAYGSKYRERTGYQWCVEASIYMHDDFQHKGIGKALYSVLMDILKLQGYRNVYAVINLPNENSVRFHENCGFRWFANYENVGYKLGAWKTVGWWLLIINEHSEKPAPPLKFSELDKSKVQEVLQRYNLK